MDNFWFVALLRSVN